MPERGRRDEPLAEGKAHEPRRPVLGPRRAARPAAAGEPRHGGAERRMHKPRDDEAGPLGQPLVIVAAPFEVVGGGDEPPRGVGEKPQRDVPQEDRAEGRAAQGFQRPLRALRLTAGQRRGKRQPAENDIDAGPRAVAGAHQRVDPGWNIFRTWASPPSRRQSPNPHPGSRLAPQLGGGGQPSGGGRPSKTSSPQALIWCQERARPSRNTATTRSIP